MTHFLLDLHAGPSKIKRSISSPEVDNGGWYKWGVGTKGIIVLDR